MSSNKYKEIATKLNYNNKAFINGHFVNSKSDKFFEAINPATGELITKITDCNSADVDLAVKSARDSFKKGVWSKSSPEFRKEVLLKLANLLRENTEEMAVLESLDSGKTINDCLNEVGNEVPNFFQWYGELIDKTFGKLVPTGQDVTSFIVKEPIGVVGLVVPWNFPLLMAAWKAAPALAAGCSIVLKPAEQTSLTAIKLAELAAEAGLPDGVLNVLPGFGSTGEAIGRHPDVDAVSFTGSTEVGALFMRYSGESNLKTVGLEMGGKSPFIILEDAKITDNLVEHAVTSAFWNGGQNCSANMRQIVDKKIKDEFLAKVIEKTKTLKVGDPLDTETEMGSMVSEEHLKRVNGYIDQGIKDGAELLIGGSASPIQKGFYAAPTLFDNLTEEMTIAKEEIFGPVLGILPVNNSNKALEVANNTSYGLHATVFTNDLDRAFYMAKNLQCGTVAINGFSEGDIKTPFGGFKQSGSLARDNGTEAIDQYLQTKTIWITHQG
ncbi:aldehyde dehydrogenase [Alphaproteobacteria bacterium]|nr:aldehyde dehydrogenase [Alphaproteobacteria bacterium]